MGHQLDMFRKQERIERKSCRFCYGRVQECTVVYYEVIFVPIEAGWSVVIKRDEVTEILATFFYTLEEWHRFGINDITAVWYLDKWMYDGSN